MKRMFRVCICSWFFSIALISSTQAMQFAVISDVRADALNKALKFLDSQRVGLILLPGDFYYDAQEYYSHFVKFGFDVSPEKTPNGQNLYFTLGNHDAPPAGDDTFTEAIAPCYPKNGPVRSPQGTIFSFDRDNCHFVITNQYWDNPAGGYADEQLKWIEQDLRASTRTFKFVFGHEPAFPLDKHVGDSLDADPGRRDRFWQILRDNGAHAFFCGHTHNLSHMAKNGVYQIDNGEVRGGGPICVTLVDVNGDKASVKSYQTGGAVPEVETNAETPNDLVIQTDIDATIHPKDSDAPEVLFSAGAADTGMFGKSCFIRSLLSD
ncbi:MAG: metallophosphoesterase [Desulfobacteraceae bacterium]|nr:MAG: metallophosphoesterase [Desulfobacteraceae bacterium]